MSLPLFFSDAFGVSPSVIEEYGAFNISIYNDLPIFIDPFLLFNSEKPEYQTIHSEMIRYLVFLKGIAQQGQPKQGILDALFTFPEIKENWMGFSIEGNAGKGLGRSFAKSIVNGFNGIIRDFGTETISESSHIEKICLLQPGVGRDFISDFTLNMALGYIAKFTESFALAHIPAGQRKRIPIRRSFFNYETGTWVVGYFDLPIYNQRHVLLCPSDILTKDSAWINSRDLIGHFDGVVESLPNEVLREQVSDYFSKKLSEYDEVNQEEYEECVRKTLSEWPALIDYYIKGKEDDGERAVSVASEKVGFVSSVFVENVASLIKNHLDPSSFGGMPQSTYDEAMARLLFLKDVIENKGGHKLFWVKDQCIDRESDLQILYRFTWMSTASVVSREVNDGRGPVDFMVSRGAVDKTLVEFKLAKNTKLKQNLQKQCEIYEMASDSTGPSIKAIFYFSCEQKSKVDRILEELNLTEDKNIVLIDGRNDNKPSGSNAA